MKIRRKRRKSEDEETSYWLSYSDMMAGLLLVFVLIISFTILQAKSQYEKKEEELAQQALVIYAMRDELSNKELLLDDQQSQLADQQSKMDEQASQLANQEALLADQQSLLEEQQSQLADQQSEMEEQKSVLETLQAMLANQEALLKDREAVVEAQQEQLAAQQEQLDRIIGVKAELIEALKNKFADTNLKVSVDPKTGDITLDSSILFGFEEYDLTASGEELLRQFIPIYLSVLLSPEFSDYVSEVIIEGHTDTEGSYIHNLELSQQRALAVATFCLEDSNGVLPADELAKLRDILTANGKSYSDPVYNADGTINMDASRRVEFSFRLNDEGMVQEMIDILNEDTTD